MHAGMASKSMQDLPGTPTVSNGNTNCQAASQERVSSSLTTSDSEASSDSEEPGSIYDAIMAAFRGQPDLLAEVQAVLSTGPEHYRSCTSKTKRTSSERTSQDNSQTPAKSLKRRRGADSQGGIPKDDESSK